MNASADGFFIMKKVRVHRIHLHSLGRERELHRTDQVIYPHAVIVREKPHLHTDRCCTRHADRNSLAMTVSHISRLLFDGMGDCMTEVQNAAKPALTLVLTHDIRLDRTGACNDMRHCGGF